MKKNLFNCEIGEAILAAAKNNEHFLATKNIKKQQEINQEVNELFNKNKNILKNDNNEEILFDENGESNSSFLHRLHQNSQLISTSKNEETINNLTENQLNEVFQSTQNNCKNKKLIKLKLPKKFIKIIEELFGEENEEKENEEKIKKEKKKMKENNLNNSIKNELELPVWLCEMFYKALHGVPIPDENISKNEESVILQNPQKRKPLTKSNLSLSKLSSLTTLYEVFPDVPPKTIKHFAKENGYDFELTANSLLNISDSFDSKLDLVSPEEPSEEEQNSVIIVPSEYPKVINPIERSQNKEVTLNQNYLVKKKIPEFNYNESLLSITELLEQLDFERRHCLSMANQVRGKPYGGALCGHYMRRAGTLRQEHLRLTYQCDRLNAWNCPNDCFIDLHGMNWKRAIELIKYKIYLCKETLPNLRKLQVITGYGSTSGHPSVIRQKLLKYLINNGIDFYISPQNQGVVEIRLQGINNF
ncbi:CUE domain-containing protein [Meloidogyne graminicola]|uniref:CUE domain-containing protein n=1 Tax=Meloidogyne graminicola TaxID=189291 RepID=A0A8S9ZBY2_9BILA|nr:CUE domain-containing protein [Meloidogyne graminicola]